jgi:anti-sigma factor RsiW
MSGMVTSPVCTIVRSSFADYLRDALPAPQRKMLRDHLAACPSCRAAAGATDPTLRFARPVRVADELPEGMAREILAAVRTGVDLLETERRLKARPRRLRASSRAAAAVAAVVLLSSGWGILRTRTHEEAFVAAAGAPERSFSPVPQPAAVQPAGLAEAPPSSSEATVYDWNPGAGREEPRVVWIVDRGLDI